MADAAAAHPPYLDRTLVWGAGEVIAVGAVFGVARLAVEAALGREALMHIENMEAMAEEQVAQAG